MSVFSKYASYYDLLYKDKDYGSEANYVHSLIQGQKSDSKSILELGCGTGRHAELLAQKGYQVHGIDFSQEMLELAKQRLLQTPEDLASQISFEQGDVRTYRTDQRFDAVVSLFHVMSYQTSNEDLQAAYETASTHLNPGGVFIFDCWYGPAVLVEKPEVRVKRLENEHIQITRIAEPDLHPNENVVDVSYDIFVNDKKQGVVSEINEKHSMRYLFAPEVSALFSCTNMEMLFAEDPDTKKIPTKDSWNVFFVGLKKK